MENKLDETSTETKQAEAPKAEEAKPNKFHAVVYLNVGPNDPSANEIISTRSMKELKQTVKAKVEAGYVLAGVFRGTHVPAKVEMKQTVSFGL